MGRRPGGAGDAAERSRRPGGDRTGESRRRECAARSGDDASMHRGGYETGGPGGEEPSIRNSDECVIIGKAPGQIRSGPPERAKGNHCECRTCADRVAHPDEPPATARRTAANFTRARGVASALCEGELSLCQAVMLSSGIEENDPGADEAGRGGRGAVRNREIVEGCEMWMLE